MKYHLYFHNDLDGLASGAVMLNFLRGHSSDILSFNPIDYVPEIYKEWENYNFKKPFILIDFRYHPAADWWFDHHGTSFDKPALASWKNKYKNDATHYQNNKYKSCCGMMLTHLKKHFDFNPPNHLRELSKWVDIIDSAGYKSAKKALDYSKPAMQLSLFLTNDDDFKNRPGLLKELVGQPLTKIVNKPILKKKIHRYTSEIEKSVQDTRKLSKLYGQTVFIDATRTNSNISHFVVYFLYPKIKYSVILKRKDKHYHLGIGKNPWFKPLGLINIGKLMLNYGGGGHKNVGATQKNSKREIIKIAQKIIIYLNSNG